MNKQFNTPEENALITACKEGNREAFGKIISKYERIVFSTVKLKGHTDSDALDISQEVFIKIWRYISKYRGDCRFSTWVYKISVNAALDYFRRSENLRSEVSLTRTDIDGDEVLAEIADDSVISPENYAEKNERIRAVREAIELLSPEQREVVNLRDMEGLSYEAISEMLGLEVGTVKSRLNRARGNLRTILAERGADKLL